MTTAPRVPLGHLVVEGHVGDEIANHRERLHRRHGDGFPRVEQIHPRHTQQPRPAVDLGTARATLTGLTVPPDGQIAGLGRLEAVNHVEDDLALFGLDRVFDELATVSVTAPDTKMSRVAMVTCPP